MAFFITMKKNAIGAKNRKTLYINRNVKPLFLVSKIRLLKPSSIVLRKRHLTEVE